VANSRLYGLVLAGGRSRRMGQDKALLKRDGRSQLANLVALLEPMVERVFVSTRSDQREEPERRRFSQIIDNYTSIGPVAGVLSAMEEYPAVDWLVVACDLPNVNEDTVRFLIDNRSAEKPFTAYRSSYDDLPEPLCAIYRLGSEVIVRDCIDAGVTCPRKMLIRSDTKLLVQTDPRALDNINTPEELQESVLESVS
jgi:molybdopterin-guanine dinucleotide biosynthesis protein A